jgi:DNA-binding transcriptional LysR family regulator
MAKTFDEMFSLGRELLHTLKGRPSDRPMRLVIGVADVLPKAIVRRLLDPATRAGAPLLLPGPNSTSRRVLDEWLFSRNLRPTVVGEFDDSELMNAFGEDGKGVFPAR